MARQSLDLSALVLSPPLHQSFFPLTRRPLRCLTRCIMFSDLRDPPPTSVVVRKSKVAWLHRLVCEEVTHVQRALNSFRFDVASDR